MPPLSRELRSFVDWVANYTLSSRGMVLRMCLRMGEHLGAERERVGVRLAGAAAAAHDAGARRACSHCSPTAWCAARARRRARPASAPASIDGLIDEGTLETVVLPPEPVARPARSGFCAAGFTAGAARRRRRAASDARQGRLFGDAARRRHRLGQDRGLFRGGGGGDPARPAEPDPDAGDRADRAVPRPLRRALRRAAGGMAFASSRRARARAPGRRSPTARSRSWSARARRCSCLTPISG